jgi:crossover junction endodeoxyribonuclease RuvC
MRFVGIDPATTTGVVILDENANVLLQVAIKGEGPKVKGGISIEALVDLENQLYELLEPGDEVLIEQPAMGTQKGVTTGMIHGGLRTVIHRKGLSFNEINPMSTKKYVDVTGWIQDGAKKRRLTTTEKKKEVAKKVKEHFDYSNKSNDITDAYIIARACLNLANMRDWKQLFDGTTNQREVTEAILNKAQ